MFERLLSCLRKSPSRGTGRVKEQQFVSWKEVLIEGDWFEVSCDYWMMDSIRWPVDYPTALSIAKQHDAQLPTVAQVDAIWKQADIKLQPQPLNPANTGDPDFYEGGMTKQENFKKHDELIDRQLRNYNLEGKLIAGHKKDIVRPATKGRVAIYGWHYRDGKPIQPYSNVHGEYYRDYSHGLRLVRLIT